MAGAARLLLVARSSPLVDGLLGFLRTIPEVQVIGHLVEPPPALAALSEQSVAVIVLACGQSLDQDPVAGVEAMLPDSRFIALAGDVGQQSAAERLGADVALLQGCRPETLVEAIRALAGAKRRSGRWEEGPSCLHD